MHKPLIAVIAALSLLPLGFSPAAAEPEPDGVIWQATGPVTSGQITGTIASNNDSDWYMFYAASQTQLTVTLPQLNCSSIVVRLRDANGAEIDSAYSSSSQPRTIKYSTGMGTNRYFLTVSGTACATPYVVSLSPTAALVPGPGMPTATTPTGEPNEAAAQAVGLLAGDVIYTGQMDTQNDEDWFTFYASAAFTIEATLAAGCNGNPAVRLLNADQDEVDAFYPSVDRYSRISYTPERWAQFFIRIHYGQGCVYRFSISPASAIQAGPPPAPTPPAGLTGITKRKTRTTVVVYWPAVGGATGYQYRILRGRKVGKWKSTGNAWVSIKKKRIPRKKGLRVQVQPFNSVGPGGSQIIRIKR